RYCVCRIVPSFRRSGAHHDAKPSRRRWCHMSLNTVEQPLVMLHPAVPDTGPKNALTAASRRWTTSVHWPRSEPYQSGSDLFERLTTCYPQQARQFCCLFSFRTEGEVVSLVAVGAAFSIAAGVADKRIKLELRRGDTAIHANFYPL